MRKYNVNVNGTAYEVTVEEVKGGVAPAPVAAPPPRPRGAAMGRPLLRLPHPLLRLLPLALVSRSLLPCPAPFWT